MPTRQPPSCGCVLKHQLDRFINAGYVAAAFVRLCVETFKINHLTIVMHLQPPSCGCVLKHKWDKNKSIFCFAAAFVRLCVETNASQIYTEVMGAAAFVRLCVETINDEFLSKLKEGSRLRAAVC